MGDMSTLPASTVIRGDITLQPGYFTSSSFVYPLREDISNLVQSFTQEYLGSDKKEPFALFKKIWNQQGWTWLNFRVFDGRAREGLISVVLRLFSERMVSSENPMTRVVALFGLYTFYFMQPSTSSPSLYSVKHLAIPIDVFKSMLSIPTSLANPELEPLRPYATHVLSTLLDSQIFHIVPESSLNAQNPTTLPREFFVADEAEPEPSVEASTSNTEQGQGRPLKKKGRPTKREKAKKAREAVVSLEKWLDKNTFTAPRTAGASNVAAQPGEIMHTLMRHPPVASGEKYRAHKGRLLDALDSTYLDDVGGIRAGSLGNSEEGREVMGRANEAVLERLKKIDEMAAERGLEVGGEGGEMTGLTRVEKAVEAYREGRSRGGILNLMEGAGMEES